jgi:uncharacterized protein YndB with AHSA1/START domain
MIDFTLTRTSTAPIESVFDKLTDHRAYKDMSALRVSKLERVGHPEPNGLGAIRRVGVVGPTQTEEVTDFDRPTRFGYTLRSGLPVRDHVAAVNLSPTSTGGTEISYRVRSTPTLPLPGFGLVLGVVLKKGIGDLLDGIVKAAERSGPQQPTS